MYKKPIIIIITLLLFSSVVYANPFTDVKENSWYYQDVTFIYNQDITSGYANGTFKPDGSLTHAEALTFLMRARKTEVEMTLLPWHHWSDKYLLAARALDLISDDPFEYDSIITREEVADMMVDFWDLKSTSYGASVFVDTDSASAVILNQLGIINGTYVDDQLCFLPDEPIKRSELAAIIHRVFLNAYLSVTDEPQLNEQIRAVKLVTPNEVSHMKLVKEPFSDEDFENLILYMYINSIYSLDVIYDQKEITKSDLTTKLSRAHSKIGPMYPEYTAFSKYFSWNYHYDANSNIVTTFTLKFSDSKESDKAFNSELKLFSLKKVDELIIRLYIQDLLTAEMSDYEKMRVVYEWIAKNYEYDLKYTEAGFTLYGAVANNTMTCQGYTSLYNMMLRRLGIEAQAISGVVGISQQAVGHSWSVVTLAGRSVYVDATWADPTPNIVNYVDMKYFDIPEEELRKTHNW
jgi:hypothetical protein